MSNTIPAAAILFKNRTRRLYLSWWITHYSVGLTGLVAGAVLTATSASTLPDKSTILAVLKDYSWLIGIIAAVCTSLVTFLGPIHKAERYWSAWHILDQACCEFELGDIGLRRFLVRMKAARKLLQAIDADDQTSSQAIRDVAEEVNVREGVQGEAKTSITPTASTVTG